MSVVIDNSGRQLFRGKVPRDSTGALCRFAVRVPDGPAVYAPTLAEALTAVVGEGYVSMPDADRLTARRVHAVTVAEQVQARFVPAQHLSVLTAAKSATVPVTTWDEDAPLVLVDSWYAPHTSVTPPGGRVLWLRPEGEWDFAVSLSDLAVLEFEARA